LVIALVSLVLLALMTFGVIGVGFLANVGLTGGFLLLILLICFYAAVVIINVVFNRGATCRKRLNTRASHSLQVATDSLLACAPARAVIGDNGFKEVQKGALVDGLILTDLNRPCCQVPLPLVNHALGIGHDGVVDENVEMILRSEQRADVAIQRKIGLLCALDGLGHVRVGGMHQISHLAANILLPAR